MKLKSVLIVSLIFVSISAKSQTALVEEKVLLGKQLYFDPRLSSTKTLSCNSCHQVGKSENGLPSGTDSRSVSIGVFGQKGGRNAPTVWNIASREVLFWDGRAASVEIQAKGPILNPIEMGMGDGAAVAKAVQAVPGYRSQFKKIFKTTEVSFDQIADAIGAYERTLLTPHSDFDRYREGDKTAMSEKALRGWERFQSLACIACHAAPTFSGKDYFVRFPLHEAKADVEKFRLIDDEGRFNVTKEPKDRNLWRVPSLRNVAITGPYFHNGSVEKLEDAVRIMGKAQLQKSLTSEDVDLIVEFLKSLTGKIPVQTRPVLPL